MRPLRHLLAVAALLLPVAARAEPLTVFAAASLTDVLKEVDRAWEKQGHAPLRFSFAASSTLARQIEQGAPVSLFISADERWMDDLARQGYLVAGTRSDLLTNQLVLVEARDRLKPVTLAPGIPLDAFLPPGERLAVGDPAHVPAGIYARQALEALHLWEAAAPRLAAADSVRSALRLVERGEAPAGIVYMTDVAASPTLAVAGVFPPGGHEPIVYPVALVQGADTPEARALLAFLHGPEAMALFHRRGFGSP
ncbi:MAG TPA: molybdate ABC transporter substrate-binding protein [Acetobacteraceae bacterium]|nr:molybdate ABC transporter substrate-binding protein [Acetobacteraceae bacterium]